MYGIVYNGPVCIWDLSLFTNSVFWRACWLCIYVLRLMAAGMHIHVVFWRAYFYV
jgi:hypothetical protein